MADVKDEVLAPNEFICKMCWTKKKDLMFRITVHDADMGSFIGSGEGFAVCDDCFSEMVGSIDTKANELLDKVISVENPKENKEFINSVRVISNLVDRRLGDLTKLNVKLREILHVDRNREARGQDSQQSNVEAQD